MGNKIKISVEFDSGIKDIEMAKPKGKHVDKIWELMCDINKTREAKNPDDAIKAANEMKDYIDNLACELSGLSKDELNDLDSDEKAKITDVITSRAGEALNFGKLSGRPRS